jgi:hypothetical protein
MAHRLTPAGYLGSQNKTYTLLTILQSHTGPLTCLTATDDGKLASGGEQNFDDVNRVTEITQELTE